VLALSQHSLLSFAATATTMLPVQVSPSAQKPASLLNKFQKATRLQRYLGAKKKQTGVFLQKRAQTLTS